jgi:inner membrane protein
MDNVTHSLTGLALARVGLKRFSPHGTALLVLSANAPDVDIVALSRGPFVYFEAHRGYTHSVLCLPLMAILCVAVTAAIFRRRLPWVSACLLCCLGVASHLLIDWTNSYGIRLLLPFSSRWFHLDLNSLYDGWIMAVLLFAAVWPLFSRLVSSEIGDRAAAGRGVAAFALAFFLLFDSGRAILHGRAVAQLEARLYDDAPALQTAALPEPFTPFRWTGVVETARAYQRLDIDALGQLDTAAAETFYKPAVTAAYLNAKATAPFRYFLYFARFPVWSEEPTMTSEGAGTRLVASDLRFGTPQSGSFHCVAVENGRHQVLHASFP